MTEGTRKEKKKPGCIRILAIIGGFVFVMAVVATIFQDADAPEPTPEPVIIEYVVTSQDGSSNAVLSFIKSDGEYQIEEILMPNDSVWRAEQTFREGDGVRITVEVPAEGHAFSCAINNKSTGEVIAVEHSMRSTKVDCYGKAE